ncbi:putative Dehydratase [Seiridium cardinale]|uniref:Dehydratase n=1 Tax=Seiridium cardinale TaxID=138064 RepID=A0ABR2YAJ6_9PEZI
MSSQPAADDVIGCLAALFEWAESFDTKDWGRLRANLAPTMRVDYRHVMGKIWEDMAADDFIPLASNPHFLGDPLLKTQHFIGASRWEETSKDEITGRHQVRVAHQRYTDIAMKEVAMKGHAHGGATTWYKRIDGVWKFAGLCPDIRWSEYKYDEIFGEH